MEQRPLAGVRVFELSIAIAGPTCGRYLAHFGADVIKVESPTSPDTIRSFGPFWLGQETHGRQVWVEALSLFNEFSAGKRSVGLNLKHPQGMAAARRLLEHCDVFLTNYSAPAVAGLGLDAQSMLAWKPDLIHAALPGFGSTLGLPYTDFIAWGPNQAPLVGFDDLTGWPDRPPCGIGNISYPDYASGVHAVVALLAALEYRDRHGTGQAIDLSQFEATVALLGPHVTTIQQAPPPPAPTRQGNRVPWAAPQGVYPCRGTEHWLALSVHDDIQWNALCHLAQQDWQHDPRFSSHDQRRAHHDELDALLSAWTMTHGQHELAQWLQEAGVPAAAVCQTLDLTQDKHVEERGFYVVGPSGRFACDLATGNPIRLSATPGGVSRLGPAMGEHTDAVLTELCGYTTAEVDTMVAGQAVFRMEKPDVKLTRPYLQWVRHMMPQLPWG